MTFFQRAALATSALCLCLLISCQATPVPSPDSRPSGREDPPSQRAFYLGFAYQPHDWSEAAFTEAFRLLERHGDIVMVTFDGAVPWQECLEGKALPEKFEAEIKKLEAGLPKECKRVLALSPLAGDRVSLAQNQGADHEPRSGKWADRSFGDPQVRKAYLNWCRLMIERFEPDYVCYGMEVDSGLTNAKDPRTLEFRSFLEAVYGVLKKEYPNKTVFLEYVLQNDEEMAKREKATTALLPFSDLYAVSTYPFLMTGGDPKDIPQNWFSRVSEIAPDKPFAVMETNWLAENFYHPSEGVLEPSSGKKILIFGREEWQANYLRLLFRECQELKAEFVIQWNVRDLDQLHELLDAAGGRMNSADNPFWKLAQDCGLYNQDGKARAGLAVWESWRALPK